MPKEIWIGLALWAIFEGLVIFAVPRHVQRMMAEMATAEPRRLRIWGAGLLVGGLVILQLVR